jgi:hypothetical protein
MAEDDVVVPDTGDLQGRSLTTKAVKLTASQSRDVDVLVYSDAAGTKNIPMRVMGYEELMGQSSTSGFTFDLSDSYADAGEKVTLTVTAPKRRGYDLAVTIAYLSETEANMWPVLVTTETSLAQAAEGANLETMFRSLLAKASAKRVPTTRAGMPKFSGAVRGPTKWIPGLGRIELPPPPAR